MSDENDSWLAGIGVDVSGVLGGVQDAASSTLGAVGGAASSVYETASTAVSSVADAAGSVYDATSSVATGAYEVVSGAASGVYDAASRGASAAYDAASSAASGAYDAAVDKYDAVSNSASSAYESVSDAASEAFDSASGARGDFVGDISNAFDEVKDKVFDDAPVSLDKNNIPQGEEPNLTRDPAVPFNVLADSAQEFFKKAAEQMGGHAVGHLEVIGKIEAKPDTDGNGRIVKVNLTAQSRIKRPRWAGGRPQPGISSNEVLKKAEQVVLHHETRHREILETHMRNAVKTLLGKPGSQFQSLFDEIIVKYDKAQDDFDAAEGQVKVIVDKDGKETDVVAAPLPKSP